MPGTSRSSLKFFTTSQDELLSKSQCSAENKLTRDMMLKIVVESDKKVYEGMLNELKNKTEEINLLNEEMLRIAKIKEEKELQVKHLSDKIYQVERDSSWMVETINEFGDYIQQVSLKRKLEAESKEEAPKVLKTPTVQETSKAETSPAKTSNEVSFEDDETPAVTPKGKTPLSSDTPPGSSKRKIPSEEDILDEPLIICTRHRQPRNKKM